MDTKQKKEKTQKQTEPAATDFTDGMPLILI